MRRSKDSITLHPEYGLNPTLCTCFYCGEDTGEIAMLGASYKGEAPRRMCLSIEPCDKCKEKFKDKLVLVENTSVDGKSEGITGRWLAIPKEYISEEFRKNSIAYIPPHDFDELISKNETPVSE